MIFKKYSYHPRMVRAWLLWTLLAVMTTAIMLASLFTTPLLGLGELHHSMRPWGVYLLVTALTAGVTCTAITGWILYKHSLQDTFLGLSKFALEIPTGMMWQKKIVIEYQNIESVTLHKHGTLTELRIHSEPKNYAIYNADFATQAEFREFVLRISGLTQTHRSKLKIAA